MNILKTGLAVLAGFILSAAFFHTPTAKASSSVHVFIAPIWMPDSKAAMPSDIPGARTIGISCIPKPIPDKAPDAAVCYVATSN